MGVGFSASTARHLAVCAPPLMGHLGGVKRMGRIRIGGTLMRKLLSMAAMFAAFGVTGAAMALGSAQGASRSALAALVGGGPMYDCVVASCTDGGGGDCPAVVDCIADGAFCEEWRDVPTHKCKNGTTYNNCSTVADPGWCRVKYRNPCAPATPVCNVLVTGCGSVSHCNAGP